MRWEISNYILIVIIIVFALKLRSHSRKYDRLRNLSVWEKMIQRSMTKKRHPDD